MADIVVFGAGQIAEVAKVYIDAHGPDRIVGFVVDEEYKRIDSLGNLPLVTWERLEHHFPPGQVKLLGPLSYRRINEFRRDRHLDGLRRGYQFTSFIHPHSHIYTRDIGENCFILEANVIQPMARLGTGVMIWSGNHIGHHAAIGDYCFLASHVALGSNVSIGERTFLAGKVGVEPGVRVGAGCVLGTGSIITADLPNGSVVRGRSNRPSTVPASRLKRLF